MYIGAKGKSLKGSLPFSQVNHVLIGLYVEEGRIPSHEMLYRVHALIVIVHEGRPYVRRCRNKNELKGWVTCLQENHCRIQYTSYDLRSTLHASKYVPVDFSRIPRTDTDVVSTVIGTESTTADWDVWHCEQTYADVQAMIRSLTITRTRVAEVFSFVCLFIYNMVIGCFMFPLMPVHASGGIVFTDTVIVVFLGVNVLIPMGFVFWRRYTRRLLTCIYTGIACSGGLIGVMLSLKITSVPQAVSSLLIIYTFNFFLWTIGMIGIKLCKMTLWFIREWEFVQ